MKKTYKIEVDCANCANLMEDAAKQDRAASPTATVNFMTQKMIVEFAEGSDRQDRHEGRAEGLQEGRARLRDRAVTSRPPHSGFGTSGSMNEEAHVP